MGAAKRFTQNPGNNAICYYRYSSDAQRDASIEQQREAAHAHAEAQGYHIIKEYEDHAISGTRDDRPQFQLMLYEVEKLRPAYLILWKTDRLSRDKYDAAIAKGRLRACGVSIDYVAESMPEDEASQILLESIYEAMAAAFITSLRKNVMRGMTYNAENALYNGHKILGYVGERERRYEIDEDTVPIVRRIFREYADGTPIRKICDELNGDGIRSVRGNEFTINSLRGILTNRSYLGEYKFGEITIPDGMPRLIDDETFQAVQERLKANQRGGKGARRKIDPEARIEDFWLTGKIACGLCGGGMQGISGTSKSGKPYYYYSCQNHRKRACKLKNQRKELMEAIVLYVLGELIHEPAHRLIIAEACYARHKEMNDDGGAYEASLESRLKEVEGKLANIMKAIEKGIFGDTMAEQMNALESQKAMLRDALLAERNRKKFDLDPGTVLKFLDGFIGNINDPDTRRSLLDGLVDKIYVYPDKLAVTCFYSDDRRELPFDETVRLIEDRKSLQYLADMARNIPAELAARILENLQEDPEEEENLDFFP